MKTHWFHILVVTAKDACHGAEIQRRVLEETEGELKLYPVTLYRSLDDLAAKGLIEEVSAPEDVQHREKRRYYRITHAGRRALESQAESLEAAARMAHAALQSGRLS